MSHSIHVSGLVASADTSRLPKRERNQHVQACVRREIASKYEYLPTDIFYCHLCFNWIVGSREWKVHCQTHLNNLGSKRCGTITYCHTLVRPAYCPFCLGHARSVTLRLKSWCRDHALWQHVDEHLQGRKWPLSCPHPLCDASLSDVLDLRFHFIDEHGLSRTVPKTLKNLKDWVTIPLHSGPEQGILQKRKAPEGDSESSWPHPKQFLPTYPPRKARRCSSTVAPSLLSSIDASKSYPTSPIDLTGSDSSTCALEATPPLQPQEDHQSEDCLGSGLLSPVRFQSCESTVVNDSIFSQFIRSPSPDDIPTTLTTDQVHQAAVDVDDLVTPSNTSFSGTSLSHHDSDPNYPPDAPVGTRQKLRICLRVEPPKTKIKLRVSASQKSKSDKRQCSPKTRKGTRQQRPQKKRKAA